MPNDRPTDVEVFAASPLEAAPTRALRALWFAKQDDWHKAHEEAQAGHDAACAWVHAMLHRDEGDQFNAEYWYRQANKPAYRGSIADERDAMIATLLSEV